MTIYLGFWNGENGKYLIPDREADDALYENKARTYCTSGTAGEKILGVPVKYCECPRLYGKRLYIVCMGYQEDEARDTFSVFNPQSKERQDFIAFYKEKKIEYLKATDLLLQILSKVIYLKK